MSIDALRGFDMFWLIGGHGLFISAVTLGGLAGHLHGAGASLLLNLGSVIIVWLILYHMYRNSIFVKV
ncbi:MAG: hypothetical protein GXY44_04385 [Phycisphaerales bacterium]|nr:hypothetical protein [Phycisphaerales bacterium]